MKLKIVAFSFTLLFCNGVLAGKDEPAQPSALHGVVENVRAATSELILHAMGLLGVQYQHGGKTPENGFDCSGFVSHVFKHAAGVVLPHNAYQMSRMGKQVPSQNLQPGDLVFYNTLRRAFSHVGIYVGDDKFIHAPSRGKAVEIADMKTSYWTKRFQGARRVAQPEPVTATTLATQHPSKSELAAALY